MTLPICSFTVLFSVELNFFVGTLLGVFLYGIGLFLFQCYRLRDKWARIIFAELLRRPVVLLLDTLRILVGQVVGWSVSYSKIEFDPDESCDLWRISALYLFHEMACISLSIAVGKLFLSILLSSPRLNFFHFGKYNPDLVKPTTTTTNNNNNIHDDTNSLLSPYVLEQHRIQTPRLEWWMCQSLLWALCVLLSRLFVSSLLHLPPIRLCPLPSFPDCTTNTTTNDDNFDKIVLLLCLLFSLHVLTQVAECFAVDVGQRFIDPRYRTASTFLPVNLVQLQTVCPFQFVSRSTSSRSSVETPNCHHHHHNNIIINNNINNGSQSHNENQCFRQDKGNVNSMWDDLDSQNSFECFDTTNTTTNTTNTHSDYFSTLESSTKPSFMF